MAGSAKQYLDHVFKDQPEALQKVQQAWDSDSEQGFKDLAGQPGASGVQQPQPRSAVSSATGSSADGGSSTPSTCQFCEDLNKLYEAGHPHFTSRMEGKQPYC